MKCRLCAFEISDEDSISILSDDEESSLTKLIVKYLYLEITKYDKFSTKICSDCKRHLQDFHEYFEKVKKVQRKLKTACVEGLENFACTIIETKSTDCNHVEESLIDFCAAKSKDTNKTFSKTEEFSFADDGTNELTKIEPIEYEPPNHKNNLIMQKKTLPGKIIVSTTLSLEKVKRSRPRNGNKTGTNMEHMTEIKNILLEEDTEKDDFIAKNMELKCEICGEILFAFKKFKSHFRKQHNRKAFITCCGLRYTQRWRLINHVRLHVDPNRFKCKYCDKTLTTQPGYDMHLVNYHGDQEKKKYECRLCKKRFSQNKSLKVHMNSHKSEAYYPCELCDKCFKTPSGLKLHTQSTHEERKNFICHVCGKELKSKQILEVHITELHAELPKSECSFCGKWVSTSYLKKHEKYHIPKEVGCDECGKIFSSEGALRSHKRGPSHKERNLACSYCGRTFKEKRFLREHVAIHTGQKDYSCKYCLRDFRSQANMRKHIRQQHVAEYAQEQEQRKLGKPVDNKNVLLGALSSTG